MIAKSELDCPYPRLCAHRGFNTVAPENTLPAFAAAISLGASEIELDVRFSKDGIPVVSHDNELQRVSNGTGTIPQYTVDQLKQFDFGSHFNPKFAGLQICTFEEVLQQFAKRVIINLHVKSDGPGPFPLDHFNALNDLLTKYDNRQYIYFMAGPTVQEQALEYAPDIRRCMAAGSDPWGIVDNAIKCKCHKVQIFTKHYSQEMIDKAHDNGILCNYFYADNPEQAKKMIDMGIDTILTNDYLAIKNHLGIN